MPAPRKGQATCLRRVEPLRPDTPAIARRSQTCGRQPPPLSPWRVWLDPLSRWLLRWRPRGPWHLGTGCGSNQRTPCGAPASTGGARTGWRSTASRTRRTPPSTPTSAHSAKVPNYSPLATSGTTFAQRGTSSRSAGTASATPTTNSTATRCSTGPFGKIGTGERPGRQSRRRSTTPCRDRRRPAGEMGRRRGAAPAVA